MDSSLAFRAAYLLVFIRIPYESWVLRTPNPNQICANA